MNDVVTVSGWPTPKGYVNGRIGAASCRVLATALISAIKASSIASRPAVSTNSTSK